MRIIKFAEFERMNYKKILLNRVIVYPTDTIYGIGCNAEKKELVARVFEIKQRDKSKPVSVIAPSKEWILKNLEVSKELVDKYLPGPYTIVAKKKTAILPHIDEDSLGVRIPKHKISELVAQISAPFVTTSANLSGQPPANSVGELPKEILNQVDLVIDGGKLAGKPSTIIDVRTELKIIDRNI